MVSQAKAMSSAGMSSTVQRSSKTVSGASCVSPKKARRQLALGKVLLPMPTPTFSKVMGGMAPKAVANSIKSAAPVGVHSSPGKSEP